MCFCNLSLSITRVVLDLIIPALWSQVSPTMLMDMGINWTLIGHSERRDIFGTTDPLHPHPQGNLCRHFGVASSVIDIRTLFP